MKRQMLASLALVCGASWAGAQCCPGVIYGRVTDATGAPIPGAEVRANCDQATKPLFATADADGKYHTVQMPYGPCGVTITARGFRPYETKVVGSMDNNPVVNATLQVGGGSSVEVEPSEPVTMVEIHSKATVEQPLVPGTVSERTWEYGAFVQGGNALTENEGGTHFMMVGFHAGKILTAESGHGLLKGNFEYAMELFPFWQAYTPRYQRADCVQAYPPQPVAGQTYVVCGNPYWTGGTYTGASLTPVIFRWNFTSGKRWMPWIQGAGGVLWTNHKFPAYGVPAPPAGVITSVNGAEILAQDGPNTETSVWNFTPQFGVGTHYFLKPKSAGSSSLRSLDFSANAIHISSASLGDKNPGVNASVQVSVGYSWWK